MTQRATSVEYLKDLVVKVLGPQWEESPAVKAELARQEQEQAEIELCRRLFGQVDQAGQQSGQTEQSN